MSAVEQAIHQAGSAGDVISENHVVGTSPEVMTKIFQQNINLAVFQRQLSAEVENYCEALIESGSSLNIRHAITPEMSIPSLQSALPDLIGRSAFVEDVALLVDMYSYLFELEEVGLRMEVLDRAMCPRFHVDKLGCRLVTTYRGVATQWLRNCDVDRAKLGLGNNGLSDDESGIMLSADCIQDVSQGDVVLLKGEGWFDNEGQGIVHRSPVVPAADKRIVVTMDFA